MILQAIHFINLSVLIEHTLTEILVVNINITIMKIEIKGNIPQNTLEKIQQLDIHGVKPDNQIEVPIETENFDGNRTPRANDISKYLIDQGGFYWGLYGSPLVARVKSEGGKRYVYDGGHRKAMYEVFFPDATTFPATVVEVEDMAEVSRLFHRINGSASKNVNNETRFINQVIGEEAEIDKSLKLLKKTDMVVMQSEKSYVPVNNLNPRWKIKAKAVEELTKMDENHVIIAVELYKKSHKTHNAIENVTGQIVKALAHIFKMEKQYFQTNGYDDFCTWYETAANAHPGKDIWLFREHSHDRLELKYTGTAVGTWMAYCGWCRMNLSGSKIARHNTSPTIKLFKDDSDKHKSKELGCV